MKKQIIIMLAILILGFPFMIIADALSNIGSGELTKEELNKLGNPNPLITINCDADGDCYYNAVDDNIELHTYRNRFNGTSMTEQDKINFVIKQLEEKLSLYASAKDERQFNLDVEGMIDFKEKK